MLQRRRRSEWESGVNAVEDNDLRGPDDEVEGIIEEVLASEARKASGLIDGDNDIRAEQASEREATWVSPLLYQL